MKTAIAIDSLLHRDESVFILELVLNLFPQSEIYTISHKQGGILGPIETRPIVSSFLSHKIKDPKDFKKKFWLIPSAVKAMPIHPSIEKIIIISRGYIHGLKLPAYIKRDLYILDWGLINQNELGFQKLFSAYVNDWREKALREFPRIAISSEYLKKNLDLPNAEVIYPTYRTEEYSFVKDEDHNFLFTHHLIYTHDLKSSEVEIIFDYLTKKNETIRVLGPDEHLAEIKKKFPNVEFGGDHCEATNSVYTHQAKVVWDLSKNFFPSKAFGSLASGRPVVVRDISLNREFLNQGAYFVGSLNFNELDKLYLQIESNYLSFDRKVLRRLGLKWNERLFKSKMAAFFN